uniref:5'-3' exoribonuclease 2 n=1 Tax=Anthurium amnicola TaxID=1678845 RepID=A0A1D1ZCV3_9ARAE
MSLHVKIRFMSVFPKKGAEKLLKSVRVRFEKLKKLEILNRMQGQNGVDLDTNRDTVSQTSRDTLMKNSNVGTADDGEDGSAAHEVEDDVVEDEEEEEELDEYESQPVGGEDGSFSPVAASDADLAGENINIGYLQQLLCSKIAKVGDYQPNENVQGDEVSDGEYQIYEQDSADSDNYFDDEDDDS